MGKLSLEPTRYREKEVYDTALARWLDRKLPQEDRDFTLRRRIVIFLWMPAVYIVAMALPTFFYRMGEYLWADQYTGKGVGGMYGAFIGLAICLAVYWIADRTILKDELH